MKKIHIYGLMGVILLAFVSCGPSKAEKEKKEQENLAKEVIAIHDEVMPRMGELSKLRKQLKEKVNEWTSRSPEARAENIDKAGNLIKDLDAADKAMMGWMHEYNGGQGLYDHQAIMEYLNTEKVKITAVKEQMNTSIDVAKAFLESNSQPVPAIDTIK